jgi:hypothetical protein
MLTGHAVRTGWCGRTALRACTLRKRSRYERAEGCPSQVQASIAILTRSYCMKCSYQNSDGDTLCMPAVIRLMELGEGTKEFVILSIF